METMWKKYSKAALLKFASAIQDDIEQDNLKNFVTMTAQEMKQHSEHLKGKRLTLASIMQEINQRD